MSPAEGGAGPLSGRRILITRSAEQAGEFTELLRRQGAEVLVVPLIRFDPPDSWEAADRAIRRLRDFSLILFTSSNAVGFFLDRMEVAGASREVLQPARVAAVGPGTAEALRRRGLKADLLPERFVAEGLLAALEGTDLAGREVLIPRAQEAREVLVAELEKRGARVTVAPVYRTVPAAENREALVSALRGGVDLVAFTASSAVRHFLDLLGPEARALTRGVRIGCIGPVTARTAEDHGLEVALVPEKSTLPDFTLAITATLSGR